MQSATGPSATGNDSVVWTIPTNLQIVKLDREFRYLESKTISAEPGYTDAYVTGFRSDGKYYCLTYNHLKLGTEFSSVIQILNRDWTAALTDKYKTEVSGGLRPSLEVSADRVLAGNDDEKPPKAYVYVFDKQ